MSSLATFGAGMLGSLSADTLLHPLDNLKCQYQTKIAGSPSLNLRDALHPRALYRGYSAVILAGAPGNGIFFLAYEAAQQKLEACGFHDASKYVAGSALATVASTSVYCPMEVVKETAFARRISSGEAVRRVLTERGPAGFFRGWSMGVATWVPYMSLYYVLYENLRISTAALVGEPTRDGLDGQATFLSDLLAGLAAASSAATVTYPLDTVKTRLQSGVVKAEDWRAVWSLFRQKGLFSPQGLLLRVLWLTPGSALNVAFYERFSTMLGGLGN